MTYDPNTGVFTWLKCAPGIRRNLIAGWLHIGTGYYKIEVDKKTYPASHLAFLYMTGRYPTLTIDHINRHRADDRWCNIREATISQQNANKGKNKRNTTGYKGVCKVRGRYMSSIQSNHVRQHIGYFDTAEQASQAYIAASKTLHGEFCYVA